MNPITLFLTVIFVVAGIFFLSLRAIPIAVVLFVIAALILFSLKMADQWEKYVILRAGRLHAVKGPGVFAIIPVLDSVAAVIDERIQTTAFNAEQALTRDTVPVNVDAIIFWRVDNSERAAIAITNYRQAIERVAQSTLRETIGSSHLGTLLSERQTADAQLRDVIGQKTAQWGIAVLSVEIRDVAIPEALQNAMSRQAQAERERQARNILGQAETEIADKFAQAAATYRDAPTALHLRAMNMLYEAIKERGSMVIVPSSAVETMGLGGSLATAALGGAKP